MRRDWLAVSAALGFTAVALGAFGAHGLREVLDEYGRGIWEKAVLYHLVHAPAVGLVAVIARRDAPGGRLPDAAGWCFAAGTALFSGSLYLLALTGMRWLGAVTPLGGIGLLAGWLCLGLAARRAG